MYDRDDPIARYYDFSFALGTKKETEYYKIFSTEIPDPVADLCCGTGILTLEIAKQKKKVYAVDQSTSMLSSLRSKTAEASPIEIIQSDMTCFALPEPVGRIYCRDAFFHNLYPEDQKATLARVYAALSSDGVFAFNIPVPNPKFLVFAGSEEAKKFTERGRYPIPNSEDTLIILQTNEIDYHQQIIETTLRFDTVDKGNLLKSTELSSWKTRYTFPHEMFYLLELCGFEVKNSYGNYDKSPWNEKSMLIIEARKIG